MGEKDKDYGMFGEDHLDQERAKLDDKLITSRIKTSVYTDYDVVENKDGVIEYRPIYPNWTPVDIAVANVKDIEEEMSIRKAMETAMSLQADGQKHSQIKEIEKSRFVKIKSKEPIKKILVLAGQTPNAPVLVVEEREGQEPVLIERNFGSVPYFQVLDAPEGESVEVFEEKVIRERAKIFLNLAPECHRLHWYCMNRLGITKSRNMETARLLHKQYTEAKTNFIPPQPEEPGNLMSPK
jgi:hypothetical protein